MSSNVGIMNRTVSEWKKILKISYTVKVKGLPFGEKGIEILGIKTEEEVLIIPETIGNFQVKKIGVYAFYDCQKLKIISIPKSVTEIGCCAFAGCRNLSSVQIEGENVEIADDAFKMCPHLANSDGFVVLKGILFGYYGSESHIVIPEEVVKLSTISFGWKKCNIKSIVIPSTVTAIPDYMLSALPSLEKIYIPVTVKYIREAAFYKCENVTIVAELGSVAHHYAIKHKMNFEEKSSK